MKMLGLVDLDFARLVKPGDCVAWGQAGAEALPLAELRGFDASPTLSD